MGKKSYKKNKRGGKNCSTQRPLCIKKPHGDHFIPENCEFNKSLLGNSYEPIK